MRWLWLVLPQRRGIGRRSPPLACDCVVRITVAPRMCHGFPVQVWYGKNRTLASWNSWAPPVLMLHVCELGQVRGTQAVRNAVHISQAGGTDPAKR